MYSTRSMNVVSNFLQWTRENPQKAQSLQNLSRAAYMMHADPANVIVSERWWCLAKFHVFLNSIILESQQTGWTSKMVVDGMKLVEPMVELTLRAAYGHKEAWDVLLAWCGLKTVIRLCGSNLQYFSVPCMWDSLKDLMSRAVPWGGMRVRRLSRSHSTGGGSPNTTFASGNETQELIIPRVASSKLRKHRLTAIGEGGATTDLTASERLPVSWYDALGMLLDVFLLLRPLGLVAAGRHMYHTVGHLNPPLLPSTPGKVPVDMMQNLGELVSISRIRTHAPLWKPWIIMFILDILCTMLSRVVRHHRVPVIRIDEGDLKVTQITVQKPPTPNASSASDAEEQAEAPEGTSPTSLHTGSGQPKQGTTTVSSGVPQVVSRDDLRVRESARNTLFAFLRDPFWSVGLKKWFFERIMLRWIQRIPLLGTIINYQLGYYLSMQYYSYMFSLGE